MILRMAKLKFPVRVASRQGWCINKRYATSKNEVTQSPGLDPTRQSSATKMQEMFVEVILTIERHIKQLLAARDLNLASPKLDELLKRIGEDNHGIV